MSCRDRGRGRGWGHGDRGHRPHSPHRGHSPHSQHRGHSPHSPHRGHSPHSQHRGHSPHSQHRGHSPHRWDSCGEKSFHFMEESQIKLTGGTFGTQVTIPPEILNPVIQPTIPYIGQLPMKLGMRLHVVGLVPHHAKQFQINFKTGVKDSDDVAFHFNPRFGQYVYMNIFLNGKWQKEELGPEKALLPGTPFKLLFIINRDFYEVHVNGVHLYTFNHRIGLERVTALGIVGDVSILWLGFEDSWQRSRSTFTIPSEVSNPVIQPSIPYVGPIAGGIKTGTRLHLEGAVPLNAKQFQINFKTGVKDSDDVAFHFNPRFGQYVYMNIFLNGKWHKEELGPEKALLPGTPFKLLFIINRDFYEVHVNGVHLYTFNHRIGLERVTTLGIVGDVSIHWLGFEDSWQTSISTFTIPSEVSNPVIQPSIPYVGPIAGGIKIGTRLHLEGAVPLNAKQFQINFKTGVKDSDNVAFHFNPRFGQYVYMNIFLNGTWQKEELGPEKALLPGTSFKLLFIINRDFYEVHVNGVHLYTFNHRIGLERVTTLGIVGDVSIHWLGFEDSW